MSKYGKCVSCKEDMEPLVYYRNWRGGYVVTRVVCPTCQMGREQRPPIVVEQRPPGYLDRRTR